MDMNPYEMDSGYPDSVNSSPRSRETDSWDGGDSVGGGSSRVRLMCSYGGKIQQRFHDNQLSYLGGDTRILAVDRNIRFASMIGKLSSFWGSILSFKYQLPNEDLDALVSVTNDEDMDNMMAEYDRLQKMGYRSSRLRLFVFPNQPNGASSQSSLGSPNEMKRDNWFVDALNVCPASRSETAPQVPWANNMPDFLFGLGGNGVEDDRNSGQRGYAAHETNSEDQEVYMGRELRLPEANSVPSSPIGHSSMDSTASAPARMNTSGVPQGSDQAEMGRNRVRGFKQDSNLHVNSNPADSSRVPETGARKAADRTAKTNILKQEQYPSEFSVVSSSMVHERAPQQPQLQVPIQEFQKLQLRQPQPQDTIAWPVDANVRGRKVYYDPQVRAVNLSNPDHMTRPDPTANQPYMPQQRQYQHGPSPSDYYMQDQRSHFVQQSYQDLHGDHQSAYQPVYFVHPGSAGQPAAGGVGGYYNPVQTVTSPVEVYIPETTPLSNPVTTVRAATTVQRQTGSDPTEPYRDMNQIHPPVLKDPYTTVAPGPVASDVRVVYRPPAPVTLGQTDPYSYQNGVYEPINSRQVYYTQAPAAMNPQ